MKNPTTIEELEVLKKGLLKQYVPENILRQLESIDITIDLLSKAKREVVTITDNSPNGESTTQEEVINAVLELMEKKGPRVTSSQILEYFTENGLFVDKWPDKDRKLGAILWAENKKKSGRIKKHKRGIWEKRKEKQQQLPPSS